MNAREDCLLSITQPKSDFQWSPCLVVSRSASPEAQAEEFSLIKDTDAQQHTVAGHDEQERSAADYDPDADRLHDDRRREQPQANDLDQMDVDEVVIEVVEEEEEEVDDLFAIGTPVQTTKTKTVRKVVVRKVAITIFRV